MDLLQNEQTGLQNSKCVQPQRERKIMSIFPSFSADRDSWANTGPSSYIYNSKIITKTPQDNRGKHSKC